jgi:hypothetical protein
MDLFLSGRPEVGILLATSNELPGILGFQSSLYFTISEFANQNGVWDEVTTYHTSAFFEKL